MADAVARPTGSGGSGGSGGSSAPAQQPGIVARLVAFYHGVMAEMKKVTWPDVPQVRSATISIIIFVLILGLLITLLDFILQGVLIKLIPSLFVGR
jgi:preprotein translocase subunit SecE